MLEWINYIWFIGEAFHQREGAPGDFKSFVQSTMKVSSGK